LCFGFHLVPCSSDSWWRPDFFCFDDSHKTVTSCVSGHLWVPAVNWVYSKGKRSVRYRICGFEDMTLKPECKHKRLTQENKLCLEKVWISEKAKKKMKRKQSLYFYMDHRRWPWIFIWPKNCQRDNTRKDTYRVLQSFKVKSRQCELRIWKSSFQWQCRKNPIARIPFRRNLSI